MAACPSRGPNPYAPKHQIQIIMDHRQIFRCRSKRVEESLDRVSATVHVGLGLDQENLFSLVRPLPDHGIAEPFFNRNPFRRAIRSMMKTLNYAAYPRTSCRDSRDPRRVSPIDS